MLILLSEIKKTRLLTACKSHRNQPLYLFLPRRSKSLAAINNGESGLEKSPSTWVIASNFSLSLWAQALEHPPLPPRPTPKLNFLLRRTGSVWWCSSSSSMSASAEGELMSAYTHMKGANLIKRQRVWSERARASEQSESCSGGLTRSAILKSTVQLASFMWGWESVTFERCQFMLPQKEAGARNPLTCEPQRWWQLIIIEWALCLYLETEKEREVALNWHNGDASPFYWIVAGQLRMSLKDDGLIFCLLYFERGPLRLGFSHLTWSMFVWISIRLLLGTSC